MRIGMILLSAKKNYHNDFEQIPICMPSKEQNKEKDSIIYTNFSEDRITATSLIEKTEGVISVSLKSLLTLSLTV